MPRQYVIRYEDGAYLGYGGQRTKDVLEAQPLHTVAAREWVARFGGEAVQRPARQKRIEAERKRWMAKRG
jgi:hypothetical protein